MSELVIGKDQSNLFHCIGISTTYKSTARAKVQTQQQSVLFECLDALFYVDSDSFIPLSLYTLHLGSFSHRSYGLFQGPSALLIGSILARESYDKETKEFSGILANTKHYHHATLNYLGNEEKKVKINDYNAAHVSQIREDLFCSSSWSMLFEDKATKLKNSIKARDAGLRGFLTLFVLIQSIGKFDRPFTAYRCY